MENKEAFNDEISFIDYLNVIIKHYKLIIIVVAVSVLIAGIKTYNAPDNYEATASIIPTSQAREQSAMSSLAAQFGIFRPSPSNIQQIINILESRVLMERVVTKHNLLTVFFEKEKIDTMSDTTKTWNGIRHLRNIFDATYDGSKNIIEMSVIHKSPKTAADILNHILTELTNYMSSEAKKVAETNKIFLESLVDKNADPLIRQNIYSMIADQIEVSMMAEVKDNFAFKVLDPPKVPDRKIISKRINRIILAFTISLFAGILLAFIMEYINKIKYKQKLQKET